MNEYKGILIDCLIHFPWGWHTAHEYYDLTEEVCIDLSHDSHWGSEGCSMNALGLPLALKADEASCFLRTFPFEL